MVALQVAWLPAVKVLVREPPALEVMLKLLALEVMLKLLMPALGAVAGLDVFVCVSLCCVSVCVCLCVYVYVCVPELELEELEVEELEVEGVRFTLAGSLSP